MKILCAVKRVIDYQVKIRVKPDGSGVETNNVKMSANPFDDIAVEEAIRLKEQGIAQEVIVVSIGDDACQETLRAALAMGADRAILVKMDERPEPLHVAKLLKAIVAQEQPSVVLLGKQAIDNDCNQTGQMLAGLLNWAQGCFVSKLTIDNNQASVVREVDGGLETLKLKLPAVITTDLRLNEPRFTSLPNIMKAKSKPLAVTSPEELNVTLQPHVEVLEVTKPSQRASGIMVNDFDELMDKLKNEAKVLA